MNGFRLTLLAATALLVPAAVAQQSPSPAPTPTAPPGPAATAAPSADVSKAFITGVPPDPTEDWAIAFGGRLYDTWWQVLGAPAPTGTNPAYAATAPAGKATGATTWRCRECHGWDYKGAVGINAQGSAAFTGIKGILAASGQAPAAIAAELRAPPHNLTPAMIGDDALARLALFVSKGTYDTSQYIDPATHKVKGDVTHGREVFQTFCAACHGLDGKEINFAAPPAAGAPPAAPDFVGNRANREPEIALHKIVNGLTNVPDREKVPPMATFRTIGIPAAVDALAYAQTLPQQ